MNHIDKVDNFLSEYALITVVERRTEFEDGDEMVHIVIMIDDIRDEEQVQSEFENLGLDFRKEASPNRYRRVVVPLEKPEDYEVNI